MIGYRCIRAVSIGGIILFVLGDSFGIGDQSSSNKDGILDSTGLSYTLDAFNNTGSINEVLWTFIIGDYGYGGEIVELVLYNTMELVLAPAGFLNFIYVNDSDMCI